MPSLFSFYGFLCLDGTAGGTRGGGKGLAFGGEGGIRSALAGGVEFLVSSGGGVRPSPGADRIAGGPAMPRAEMTCAARTGGAATGLPGNAARVVGVTVGWGIT